MADRIEVNAKALQRVLFALNGPEHYIRELQVTRGTLFENPIDTLMTEFVSWAAKRAKGGSDDA